MSAPQKSLPTNRKLPQTLEQVPVSKTPSRPSFFKVSLSISRAAHLRSEWLKERQSILEQLARQDNPQEFHRLQGEFRLLERFLSDAYGAELLERLYDKDPEERG